MRVVLMVLMALFSSLTVYSADDVESYKVENPSKEFSRASLNTIPKTTVSGYLDYLTETNTFRDYEGMNSHLRENPTITNRLIQLAAPIRMDMSSEQLYFDTFEDGLYTCYLAGIRSVDARALRLAVDLSKLGDEDELWVIDTIGPRAFGPYTNTDRVADCKALPTTQGDTAVIMLRTLNNAIPEIVLRGISHFYVGPTSEKVMGCNVNIACEQDEDIQALSGGIGLVVIWQEDLVVGGGSGCLLFNDHAPDSNLGPTFLTANHVIGTPSAAAQAEIIWDFRSTACHGDDSPEDPIYSELPRSEGTRMLATNPYLDLTLMELDFVPEGEFGRQFLKWSVQRPVRNEDVFGIHYPDWSHMRISKGHVYETDLDVIFGDGWKYENETSIIWERGVTEAGSSGSPILFYENGEPKVFGTLTGGAPYYCSSDTGDKLDYYSSFRDFYIVLFPDSNLRNAVRSAIRLEAGAIGLFDLIGQEFTSLNASNGSVSDISGLEFCTDLQDIDLSGNNITDIGPLIENVGLKQGAVVDLQDNPVNDEYLGFSLAILTQRGVSVQYNRIVEFPDQNLESAVRAAIKKSSGDINILDLIGTDFTTLDANERNITDLSGIEYCADLRTIDVADNNISDLGPLRNLYFLNKLDFSNNNVDDLSDLIMGLWLSNNDIINMMGNPLDSDSSCGDVLALKNLGVIIHSNLSCEEQQVGCFVSSQQPSISIASSGDIITFVIVVIVMALLQIVHTYRGKKA